MKSSAFATASCAGAGSAGARSTSAPVEEARAAHPRASRRREAASKDKTRSAKVRPGWIILRDARNAGSLRHEDLSPHGLARESAAAQPARAYKLSQG